VPAAGCGPQSLVLEDGGEGLAGPVIGERVASGRVLITYLQRGSNVDSRLGEQSFGLPPTSGYALQLTGCEHPLNGAAGPVPTSRGIPPDAHKRPGLNRLEEGVGWAGDIPGFRPDSPNVDRPVKRPLCLLDHFVQVVKIGRADDENIDVGRGRARLASITRAMLLPSRASPCTWKTARAW